MSTIKVQADRHTLRGARARLDMTQDELARAAGISRLALVQCERGTVAPHRSTLDAIQTALEARGSVFTNDDKPGFYFDKDKVAIPT